MTDVNTAILTNSMGTPGSCGGAWQGFQVQESCPERWIQAVDEVISSLPRYGLSLVKTVPAHIEVQAYVARGCTSL